MKFTKGQDEQIAADRARIFSEMPGDTADRVDLAGVELHEIDVDTFWPDVIWKLIVVATITGVFVALYLWRIK